jgi:lipid-binding SYLF domain-containing protein
MKKYSILSSLFFISFLMSIHVALAQSDEKKKEIRVDSREAKEAFIKQDSGMVNFFNESYGYLIFPNVGKGGLGIGAAAGNGVAFENGKMIGYAKLSQVSIGFQAGGQAYSEFIFIEDDATLGNFKRGNYELGAQASAVAVTAGASADADFNGGMAIFTQAKGGLMYEASVGGQKFKVEAK